jgi:hypothetical protein
MFAMVKFEECLNSEAGEDEQTKTHNVRLKLWNVQSLQAPPTFLILSDLPFPNAGSWFRSYLTPESSGIDLRG